VTGILIAVDQKTREPLRAFMNLQDYVRWREHKDNFDLYRLVYAPDGDVVWRSEQLDPRVVR
jgi:hypothetical protein